MTRAEFCELLVQSKLSTQTLVPAKVLENAAKLTFSRIAIIESGKTNFRMSEAFTYLQMCGDQIVLFCWHEDAVDNATETRIFLTKARQAWKWSIGELSKRSGVPTRIIKAYEESKSSITVDTFLKLANALEVEMWLNSNYE